MKKGIHIVTLKKAKTCIRHRTTFVILYSILVHVESPKYIFICLKSAKSSEFAIQTVTKNP